MSYHNEISPEGGEAVGLFDRLPPAERLIVTALRRWPAGPEAQAEVWNDFAALLGAARGRRALRAFEAFIATLALAAARALWHHGPECPCVGRDEAEIAATITCAARGDGPGARSHAERVARAEAVPALVAAAAVLGEALADGTGGDREGSASRTRCFRRLH